MQKEDKIILTEKCKQKVARYIENRKTLYELYLFTIVENSGRMTIKHWSYKNIAKSIIYKGKK